MLHNTPSYFNLTTNLVDICDRAIQELTPHTDRFDTVVGIGLSGGILVPMLGEMMRKNWAVCRKSTAVSHSSNPFEGRIGDRWLFVDDFVSSGLTFKNACTAIKEGFDRENHHDVYDARVRNWVPKPREQYVFTEWAGMYLYGNTWSGRIHFRGAYQGDGWVNFSELHSSIGDPS